ncbi:hypothetical protein FLX56_27540 [Synechococcus moorigangaii CMS01]|nr:hypothetical protein [Synechococcus moorigangaii CMS01]
MKPRANLRLDATLLGEVEAAARARKTTKTEIVEEALRCYFDTDRNRAIEDRLMSRMDAIERRMGRLSWTVDLCVELVSHFVLYWLTRTGPIPEQDRETARALGQRRFDHFIAQVAAKVGQRRTLVEESLCWEDPDPE